MAHNDENASPPAGAPASACAISRASTGVQARRREAVKQAESTAREDLAAVLDRTLETLARAGHRFASNRAIAGVCGVDEKTVRDWRAGRKSIPGPRIRLLPPSVRAPLLAVLAGENATCSTKERAA